MSEDWVFYLSRVDGEPASIFVDAGIFRSVPICTRPITSHLRVFMLQPRSDGLSSQAEFETLCALEDEVTSRNAATERAVFVGRNTSGGNRDFYFYSESAAAFESAAKAAMTAYPDYRFEVGSRADPDWRIYREFLYPSLEQWERIKSQRVRDTLAKHGDQGDQPRMIDHLAMFTTEANCEAYAAYARKLGFSGRITRAEGSAELGWRLEFSRSDVPNKIDALTIDLGEAARERHGDYDGWGCSVVT